MAGRLEGLKVRVGNVRSMQRPYYQIFGKNAFTFVFMDVPLGMFNFLFFSCQR